MDSHQIKSDDAEIFYWVLGEGPPVVLLHPFPANHEFWLPVAQVLATRYRVILPDLRGHGDSGVGQGPATMDKHAADIACVMDDAEIGRAPLVAVSIGGYALFEFWRRHREHVAALVLANTRATAETPESRTNRLALAEKVLREGTAGFIEEMLPNVLSPVTLTNRPDIVDAARRMMQKMSPQDIAGVQQGMADRPDSVPTLKTISIPALVIVGEDEATSEAELMRQQISGSRLQVVPRSGHYAVLEQPEEFTRLLRSFLDGLPRR